MQDADGWRCSAGHVNPEPRPRFLCSRFEVADHTGTLTLQFFGDVGRQVLGCEAEALAQLWGQPEQRDSVDRLFRRASWKRLALRFRSARDTWQGEGTVRLMAESAQAPDLVKEGRRMMSEINAALAVN